MTEPVRVAPLLLRGGPAEPQGEVVALESATVDGPGPSVELIQTRQGHPNRYSPGHGSKPPPQLLEGCCRVAARVRTGKLLMKMVLLIKRAWLHQLEQAEENVNHPMVNAIRLLLHNAVLQLRRNCCKNSG